jgi:hypothetical protein
VARTSAEIKRHFRRRAGWTCSCQEHVTSRSADRDLQFRLGQELDWLRPHGTPKPDPEDRPGPGKVVFTWPAHSFWDRIPFRNQPTPPETARGEYNRGLMQVFRKSSVLDQGIRSNVFFFQIQLSRFVNEKFDARYSLICAGRIRSYHRGWELPLCITFLQLLWTLGRISACGG